MKLINIKQLGVGTLVLGAFAWVSACSTEQVDTPTDNDSGIAGAGATPATGGTAGSGTGGAAGSTATGGTAGAGTGGTAGAGTGGTAGAGTGGTAGAGTGGTAGAGTGGTAGAGTGGTAGTGGACLGDTPAATSTCSSLAYATTDCSGAKPSGMAYCEYFAVHGRPAVFEAYFACANAITGDACATAHDDAVGACLSGLNACDTAPFPDGDGGTVGCADVAATCAQVSEAQCWGNLNLFDQNTRRAILNCYACGTGDCATDFEDCVNEIDSHTGTCN